MNLLKYTVVSFNAIRLPGNENDDIQPSDLDMEPLLAKAKLCTLQLSHSVYDLVV